MTHYKMTNFFKSKEYFIYLTLFFIAFIYMNFFTLAVPYFWDCPWFIFHEPGKAVEFIKQAFTVTQNKFEGDRPIMNLFFYFNTMLFEKDYFFMRIVKNLFFASYIMLAYTLIKQFLHKRFYALFSTFFILFSFPVFLHTVIFSEPFIYTEPLKIIAFLLFLSDFMREKTSILKQIFIVILLQLAFKSYAPNYSAVITLLLFTLFYDFHRLKRYAVILIYLVLLNFPLGKILHPEISQETSRVIFNFTQFNAFFIQHTLKDLFGLPSFSNLYYKSFIQVISPFMFLTVIFYTARLLINKETVFLKENKITLCFFLAYFLPELFIWFVLPESASRYFSSQALPIALFIGLIFISANQYFNSLKLQKWFMALIFIIYIVCNFSYTYLFRATWLSSEMGKRKVADFIEESKKDKTIVFFEAENVAPGYAPLSKNKNNGWFAKDTKYFRTNDFNISYLKSFKNYSEIYIIQKETSFKNRLVPDIDFSKYNELQLIKVIEGRADCLFDNLNSAICATFKINYHPNIYYIYKFIKQ